LSLWRRRRGIVAVARGALNVRRLLLCLPLALRLLLLCPLGHSLLKLRQRIREGLCHDLGIGPDEIHGPAGHLRAPDVEGLTRLGDLGHCRPCRLLIVRQRAQAFFEGLNVRIRGPSGRGELLECVERGVGVHAQCDAYVLVFSHGCVIL